MADKKKEMMMIMEKTVNCRPGASPPVTSELPLYVQALPSARVKGT